MVADRHTDRIASADGLVVPAVGASGAAMTKSARDRSGIGRITVGAAGRGLPVLGICLGMQLLFERSHESA